MKGHGVKQKILIILSWLPVYTAIVTTITLFVILFGVPFVGGI